MEFSFVFFNRFFVLHTACWRYVVCAYILELLEAHFTPVKGDIWYKTIFWLLKVLLKLFPNGKCVCCTTVFVPNGFPLLIWTCNTMCLVLCVFVFICNGCAVVLQYIYIYMCVVCLQWWPKSYMTCMCGRYRYRLYTKTRVWSGRERDIGNRKYNLSADRSLFTHAG